MTNSFFTNYLCLVERKHNEIVRRERQLINNTNWRMLLKVCCKSMYQAEYGLKRPLALPRGLGRQVLFTMIDWQFRPSRLSTVFKSICLMTSCKMSTPLIHRKNKHLKYNTYQYYVSLISSQPHYIKESVYQYVFHFVHNVTPKNSLAVSRGCKFTCCWVLSSHCT